MFAIPICVFGRNKTKQHHYSDKVTIGFKTGRTLFSTPAHPSHKMLESTSHKLFLRKTIGPNFKIETGLDYYHQQNQVFFPVQKGNGYHLPYRISIPVSVDYFILPETAKIRPYFGVGMQYNFKKHHANPIIGETINTTPTCQAGTKFVSILLTQGVTFEVNTKIQITQSIHFYQYNNEKVFGVDIGIGFKIP